MFLVSGLALTKYRCEFVNLNCIFAVAVVAKCKVRHAHETRLQSLQVLAYVTMPMGMVQWRLHERTSSSPQSA